MVDGRVVVPVEAAYRAGTVARVPFIAGSNSDDLGFTFGKDPWERFGPNADLARHYYNAYGPGRTRMGKAVAADASMTEPARFLVSLMRRHGQPAWYYRAGYTPEAMRQVWALGLPHAHEIPFFLSTIDVAGYVGPTTRADQAMSTVMSANFVNFARTGNPNGPGLPAWPMYDDKTRPIMEFALEGPRGGADPWRERLDLIEAAAEHPGEAAPAQRASSGGPVMAGGLTAQPPFTTTTALIGDILDDPAAKAILDQHLPGLSNSDYIGRLRELTLKSVQTYMPSVVTDHALAAMDADFARPAPQ
jgi:para-nitrobenzyl esterase